MDLASRVVFGRLCNCDVHFLLHASSSKQNVQLRQEQAAQLFTQAARTVSRTVSSSILLGCKIAL
ncbi:UNVERIFIED_CONTAM: hypothetical protein NY603_40360, partial [Bacteroidetes bacterium 56_B9]